jgi:hypothetical protein
MKDIRKFLGKLTDLEFRYMRIQISMANDARNLVFKYHLTKEQFCEIMRINLKDYNKYLTGGFDYDVIKMALMQAAFYNLETERIKKETEQKVTNIITSNDAGNDSI